MSWFQNNWDKVVTIGVGAVVGFYSGVFAINGDISSLRERTATLESKVANFKPINDNVAKLTQQLVAIEKEQGYLRNQSDLSVQTNKLLDLRLEQERSKTIMQLKALLAENK